jgi:MATE family multidrug resistance protein
MLRLAAPLVMAELGWMGMGIVDTMMVGRVSAEAIGAVSLGSVLFYTVAIFGSGLMLGLDTLVSQSFGAGKMMDCHRSLVSAVYLTLPLAPALMLLTWCWVPLLGRFGIHPAVLHQTVPYLRAIIWSTFPLLLYFALRRYLQAMNRVTPIMFALITANLVNVAGNWILVYGHFGVRAMGAEGSGWATCFLASVHGRCARDLRVYDATVTAPAFCTRRSGWTLSRIRDLTSWDFRPPRSSRLRSGYSPRRQR